MPHSTKYFVTHDHTYHNNPQLRLFVVHNPQIPENRYHVLALCDQQSRDFVLHWGVGIDSPQQWAGPPASIKPPFQPSPIFNKDFAVTPFVNVNQLEHDGELQHWIDDFIDAENLTPSIWCLVIIRLPATACPIVGISFVLNCPLNNEWIKNGSANFNIDLAGLSMAEMETLSLTPFLAKYAPQDTDSTLKWRVRSGKRTFLLHAMLTARKPALIASSYAVFCSLRAVGTGAGSDASKQIGAALGWVCGTESDVAALAYSHAPGGQRHPPICSH